MQGSSFVAAPSGHVKCFAAFASTHVANGLGLSFSPHCRLAGCRRAFVSGAWDTCIV
jgi:hypothetical protein